MRIIVKERGFETRSIPITDGNLTVGRLSDNPIVLKNRYASGRHCEIVCEKGECTVVDLGSTNALFVNGLKVGTKRLENGDRILAGAALLIYVADEQAVDLERLVAQLQEGSTDEREIAANLLGQFGTTAVVGLLIRSLKDDPESRVKAAAAEALGLLGDSRAGKILLAFFDTPDSTLRNPVVRATIRIADDRMVDGLSKYLKHENRKTRSLAAFALGQIHNPRATKYLVKAISDDAFTVRETVVKALGDLGDSSAMAALMQAANEPDRYSQVWVIEALGKMRSSEPVPILMKALADSSPEVREAAADALGKLRTREAAPALISALDDTDSNVRKAAATSLEKLRKHIEVGQKLSEFSGGSGKTIHISSVGEDEERESPGEPLFGEDGSRWQKWWSEQSGEPPADSKRDGRGKG